MDFIKEENHIPCILDFLDQILDIFLEGPAVLGTSLQAGNVDGNQFLVLDGSWHITIDNGLGQAFYYCRLTNPSISDQDRIVLGAAG